MSHLSSLQLVLFNIVCNIHICVRCAWITSILLSLCFCFSLSGELLVISGRCRRRRWFASGRWTPRDQPCSTSTYLKSNVPILPLCPWRALLGDLILYPWPLQPLTFHQREEGTRQSHDGLRMVPWWTCLRCAAKFIDWWPASSCQLLAKTWMCSPLGLWDLVLVQGTTKVNPSETLKSFTHHSQVKEVTPLLE